MEQIFLNFILLPHACAYSKNSTPFAAYMVGNFPLVEEGEGGNGFTDFSFLITTIQQNILFMTVPVTSKEKITVHLGWSRRWEKICFAISFCKLYHGIPPYMIPVEISGAIYKSMWLIWRFVVKGRM